MCPNGVRTVALYSDMSTHGLLHYIAMCLHTTVALYSDMSTHGLFHYIEICLHTECCII